MPRLLPVFAALTLALTLTLAACDEGSNRELLASWDDVTSMTVSGTANGPRLIGFRIGATDTQLNPFPVGADAPQWTASCTTGITEAAFPQGGLDDAWDGSSIAYDGVVDFAPGALRAYTGGTLVLTCRPASDPAGVGVVRHLVFPGGAAGGRFAVEVVDLVGTSVSPAPLAPFGYEVRDGTGDTAPAPWQDYGSVGPFAWATKGASDLTDPAIGLLPLTSPGLVVDPATSGASYRIAGADGAALVLGQRASFAMVAGIRGGFSAGDAAGKDAAMQALGTELGALAGGAFCAPARPTFHAWAEIVDFGPAIASAICDGYAALP
jgi:hypothetical protein